MILRRIHLSAYCLGLFIGSMGEATAQTVDGPLMLCRKMRAVTPFLETEITLRLYPFGVTTKTIGRQGATLLQTIEGLDLLAIRAQSLRQEIVKGSGEQQNLNRIHIYARKATPDTMILARGGKIIVFPRLFLLHPRFANLQLLPGDFVGTVDLGDDNKAIFPDAIRSYLKSNAMDSTVATTRPFEITYRNRLNNSESKLSLKPDDGRLFSAQKKLFKLNEDDRTKFQSILIVNAVRRHAGGIEYLLLSPMEDGGMLSNTGILFRSMFTEQFDSDTLKDEWRRVFDNHNAKLRDADLVETMAAELLEIF